MPETTNAHIIEMLQEMRTEHRRDLGELRKDMQEVKRRTTLIENARVEARSAYDANWNDVKVRLERIEFQTTRTNGRVSLLETGMNELGKLVGELREWKSYMSGVAASFSWWKPALATISAAAVIYIASNAT
jgi:hypothetical protein